jgi:hypothetical protein
MAATGYTPISLYYSTTAAAVPVNTNLVAGELAINTVDEKLYFKNSAGTVKLLASNGATTNVSTFSAGTTGFTPSSATSGAVTLAGTLAVANGGTNATTASITSFNNITGYTASGATGTTSTNLVFSTTPTITTPVLTNPTVSGYVESVVAITLTSAGAVGTLVITAGTVLTATLTAGVPCTFAMPTSPVAGQSFILRLTQAATSMTTATFTGVKWPGGTAPTITATASAVDIISFVYIGTSWYGNAAQAFA